MMVVHSEADLAALLVLHSVDGIGPTRLRWLVGDRPPADALASLCNGSIPSAPPPPGVVRSTLQGWARAARRIDGRSRLADHRALGVDILHDGHPCWPFDDDPEPPGLLFALGDLALFERPAAAIVGTRRCTSVGRRVAATLAAELASPGSSANGDDGGTADGGVAIVSGLALGIDAEAHWAALAEGGTVIGVVASGLDRPYPASNRDLWRQVASQGLLVSETPLGLRPDRWRFPARNRLIAALSDVVVVVESHQRGGALITVDEAERRGIPVGVVPGSVLSSASDGTNQLLFDGAAPVRSAVDIVGLAGWEGIPAGDDTDAVLPGPQTPSSDVEEQVLAEVAVGAPTLDFLVADLGHPRAEVLSAVQRLVGSGAVELDGSTVRARRETSS